MKFHRQKAHHVQIHGRRERRRRRCHHCHDGSLLSTIAVGLGHFWPHALVFTFSSGGPELLLQKSCRPARVGCGNAQQEVLVLFRPQRRRGWAPRPPRRPAPQPARAAALTLSVFEETHQAVVAGEEQDVAIIVSSSQRGDASAARAAGARSARATPWPLTPRGRWGSQLGSARRQLAPIAARRAGSTAGPACQKKR